MGWDKIDNTSRELIRGYHNISHYRFLPVHCIVRFIYTSLAILEAYKELLLVQAFLSRQPFPALIEPDPYN